MKGGPFSMEWPSLLHSEEFQLFKGGGRIKFYPVLRGGGAAVHNDNHKVITFSTKKSYVGICTDHIHRIL